MKVQCDVCEKAAATLLCCADEAALCAECDQQVHAANKLAGKHERVPFIGQHPSSCDICQEKLGRFFCVEDRALLCRECDVSIHTANKLVGKHKRFLVSGVQVGLDAMAPQSMAPPPHSPAALLVCKSSTTDSVANTAAMEAMQQRIPNPQQAICPSPPPPLGLCKANWTDNIYVTAQTFMHNAPNLQATTWPSPLIPPITFLPPHPHQLASPTSTCLADCLVHLDELLNANTTTTTFLDTPPRMSIPNLGWEFPNNTLTWDMVNANTYLFEDSLAEVPSTPSASIEYQSSFKRKRPVDELIHSTFDHTLLVPNNIFPPFKESKISFFGGGNGR